MFTRGALSVECLNIAYKASFSESICHIHSIVFSPLVLVRTFSAFDVCCFSVIPILRGPRTVESNILLCGFFNARKSVFLLESIMSNLYTMKL